MKSASSWDAKTITAVAALVAAVAGGVELRVKVESMSDRIDRMNDRLGAVERAVEVRFGRNP